MSNPFARLENLSAHLNETSDSINEAIKRIDAKLASLRLGVQVWLQDDPLEITPLIDRHGNEMERVSTFMGYAKINGAWQLAVTDDRDVILGDDSTPPSPLLQASREYRIKALQRIPKLIKVLEEKAEAELKDVQAAVAIADSL